MRVKLDKGALMPKYAHKEDAGADIFSPVAVEIPARGSVFIDTGVHIELPKGTTAFLKSKSGLNSKHNIVGEGVIDEGYGGSIGVKLYNLGDKPYQVEVGDKIIQLVVLPVIHVSFERANELAKSDRGNGGFGSTGRK